MVSVFRVTKNVVVHCKDRMITIVDVDLEMYQIRRPIPGAAKDKPNASPSPSSPQPSSKQANTIPEPVNSPRRPLTRSQSSSSTKSAVPTTPSSSQPSEGLSQVVLSPTSPLTRSQTSPILVEKRQAQPSSMATGRRTKSRPQLLNPAQSQTLLYSDQDLSIVRVDLYDFHDFDVLDLGQPQIPQLDAFDSDVDENVEEQVEEYLESDIEDSDFNVDEQEESDEVSLDDDSDDNELLDELGLELDTEQRTRLGHVDADGSQVHVVVSKMAKGKPECCCGEYGGHHHDKVWGESSKTHSLEGKETYENTGHHQSFKECYAPSIKKDLCSPFLQNFAAHYPGAWFYCFFYIATNAYSSFVHLKAMDKIKQKESAAYQWKLYENIIHPISDPCMWGDTNLPTLDPPVELRKRGRPEKHNRRECKQCKQLGHTSFTCGRPRDESGRLLEKYKKKRNISTRPVERPRKTLCTTGTSVGTSDPTSTATEAPQPNLVNLDYNM
ncbi:hypothetical protein Cgig2_004535 [Carnegiea gigantea]|uniref:Uncharacterized protein n=1 Tax=Carnegiea gigantea TaxID=171969 RepID=A0A9Q1K7Q2_9CARY|nr:hypothetical protein Cgig2_004535 [Carnegiea gigantea]